MLPYRDDGKPYLFNATFFQLPAGNYQQQFVKEGQNLEPISMKISLVPKGFCVFGKYRGDPLMFEHHLYPYTINDPLFQWGGTCYMDSRLRLSIPYVGVIGLHYIRVPKGQLLLVMINGT